jgi:hypothetical protein
MVSGVGGGGGVKRNEYIHTYISTNRKRPRMAKITMNWGWDMAWKERTLSLSPWFHLQHHGGKKRSVEP